MEPAGARLKEVRLEKGLSLEEVHKKTKIHLKVLKALEEDNLLNIKPIYVRGFLKIYCRFLKVDPADYIAGYKEQSRAVRSSRLAAEKVSLKLKPKAGFPGLDFIKPYFTRTPLIYAAAAAVFLMILFTLGKLIGSHRKAERPLPAKPRPNYSLAVPGPQLKSPEESSRQNTSQGLRLAMRAKKDCYINLKTDGHTVFQRILSKGRSETWNAKEKIEFSLSDASAVTLEINGSLIPSLSKKRRVLKNIVISKDGQINIR